MLVVAIVLAVLLAVGFALAGVQKVSGATAMMESADHLGVPRERYRLIGGLEILAAVGLIVGIFVSALGIAAAVGLVLLMAGAVAFHLRAGDKVAQFGPALALGVVSLLEVVFRAAA